MGVKIENIIVGFTCNECEHEETAGLDSLVITGAPMCPACDTEMDADSTADVLPEDSDEDITPRHIHMDADHRPTSDAADDTPTTCTECGLAIHTDAATGVLRHGFDPS